MCSNNPNCNTNGNVLLDHLQGATTEKRPGGVDMQAEMDALADQMHAGGKKFASFRAEDRMPQVRLAM